MNEIKQRLRTSRNWLALIEELEAEAEKIEDRKERSRRLYVLGQACEELFLRKDKAMVNYQKAFKLFPQDVRPLARARHIYREMGNLRMVAKLMEFQLKVTTVAEERAALMVELALIYIDLRMVDQAKGLLGEAQSLAAGATGLAEALSTLNYQPGAWPQLVSALVDEAAAAVPAMAAKLLVRAARIYSLEAPDEQAREDLLRKALELDPESDDANFLLEMLLAEKGRTPEIVEIHQARARRAPQQQRVSVCRGFASLWATRFNELEVSANFYDEALHAFYRDGEEGFPGHLAAFRFLREVRAKDAAGASALLQIADEALKAPLLEEDLELIAAEAGEVAWREMKDPLLASSYFDWVRKIDADNALYKEFRQANPDLPASAPERVPEQQRPTSPGLQALAEPLGIVEPPPLAPVEPPAPAPAPEPAGEVVYPVEDRRPTSEMSPLTVQPEAEAEPEVEVEAVAEPEVEAVAEPEVEAVAEPEPEPAPVERVVDSIPPSAVVEPAPVPEVTTAPSQEFDEQVDAPTAQLFADATHAEQTSHEKGIEAWRKAAQKAKTARTPRRALARLYRGDERWNALVDVLKEEVDLCPTSEEKVAILREMVELYRERLNLDVMVVNALNQILQLEPGHVDVLDELAAQYEKMNRWTDLISVLKKKAEAALDLPEKVATWSRVASLFLERFSNQAEAIKAFEQVIELDPTHEGAISNLKVMYERRRDWDRLIGIYQREIDLLQSDSERAARYQEVAEAASTKLKRPQVSQELWGKVLEHDPQNLKAMEELEGLYEKSKEWDKLADVCARQVELISDVQRKVQIFQKLGILFSEKAQDDGRAIEAWKGLLEIDPENRRAQDSLKKLYLQQKNYDELEAFYAAQNKWDEFIRVLERQAETEEAQTKIDLNFKIANLWLQKLEKPDRAVRAYEKVLSLDGENLAAAEALIPLYEGGRDVKKYVEVLEIQLRHTEGDESRLERMRNLAQLSEEKLRDRAAAFGWYLKAFEVDPRAEWAREQAERLAGEVGHWPDLVAAYEAAYERLLDPLDLLPVMLTVARVFEEQLASTEEALRTNKRILELEPQNEQAVLALERLYTKTEQWTPLLEIYQKKIELVQSPDERKEIYFRIAYLYEEEIKDPQKAIEAYRTVLDMGGEDPKALRALDQVYEAQSMWTELADTLLRELGSIPEQPEHAKEVIALKFRLGAIREQNLGDVPGAIDAYRDVLQLDLQHEGARAALERRLVDQDHQLTAAQILEPIYTELMEWQRLIDVHEIQLARESDPLARVDLLMRIGNLWMEKMGEGGQAFQAFSRCFKEEPQNEMARQELERLASIQESWSELAALYEAATHESLDASLQHELLTKLAFIMDERLEQPDRAVEFYRRAQELEPDNIQTLEALEKLYTKSEQWSALLEVYRRKADLSSDPAQREALFFRMAYLWEEMLQNNEEAVSTYKEVLAQDDANLKALRALDRLYQVQGAWHELADNLSRQLSLTEDQQETIELLVRLASLRETQLGEVAAAVDTYRQVLELAPDNEPTIAALERLIANEEHQLAVAQILEPIYKTADDWKKLVQVYEIMVSHTYDPARKIELLHRIGELYEIGGDDSRGAFAVYGRALREDASNAETQSRIEKLARELDAWEELVGLYNQLVADVMDEVLAVSLHMKVASIYEDNLQDPQKAAEAYHRVLAVDAGNLDAVNSLEQIYIRTEQHRELVQVKLKKAEIILEADQRKSLFYSAAQIFEEVLEEPEQAIKVYQMVLELDDSDATAIAALERLYERLERWESLKDIFARKVELAQEIEDKKRILSQLGRLHEERLGDLERAIETFQGVLDLDPEDLSAIRSLDRLYQQAARWYDLLPVLERQVELAGPSPEAVDLKHRVGKLWEHELGDLTRAVETYREVLTTDPSHEPTLAALDAIVHGQNEPVLAAQVLEPFYEQAGEFEKLIDLYEVMVRHADDPYRKIELLHRIADLYEHRLDQSDKAFEAYSRSLREDIGDEQALAHLERLADQIRGWEQLATLYEEELAKLLDPVKQVEMGLRVARVYEEELNRPADAIAKFTQVLEVDLENRDAVLALDRLYQTGERWTDLAEILRREIRMAEKEEDIVALQFRLGQLFQENLQDLVSAIECYREILAATPDHGPSITSLELLFEEGHLQGEIAEILEPLYRMSEQWEKLVKIMQVQLSRLEAPTDRVTLIQRIAEICEQRLGDHTRAFEWWCQAFLQDPQSEMAGEEAERLARIVDGWESLAVDVYAQVAEQLTDLDAKKHVLMRKARVFEEEILDRARAEESFLQVLALDEKDAAALGALDRIYDQSGMFQELADVLRRRIPVTDATPDLVELQLRLGRTCEGPLEDLDSAVAVYGTVLETDSRNAAALDALERIYFKREQWKELFAVYEKLVDIAPGDSGVAECYARMAKISSDALGDAPQAQDLWNRVLDLRGEDPTALWALADLYEAAEEWRELVEVLQRQVGITSDPQGQVKLYQRLGRIWGEKLGRDRNALENWQKVLDIEPSNQPALYAISAIYRSTQAWEELSETLHKLIELGITTDMPEDKLKALYIQLGQLQGEILLRPQEAIDAWRKVLDLQGDNFEALGALEALLTQEARWEECIQILERKADVLQKTPDKIDVLMQAAGIWQEKVGNAESAARVYERILQLEAGNRVAFTSLDQIYREGWHWEKLVELLLARTEHAENKQEFVELLQDVARIYEEKLEAPEQAFVVLQAAFKQDYTNDLTAKNLERLAPVTNKWPELLMDYNTVVQNILDPKVKADLLVKMGRWYGTELGHMQYAIASLQQALQIEPECIPALEVLAAFMRKTAQWAELVSVLNRHAELEPEPDKRVELFLAMAELFENQLADATQAIAAYRKAMEVDGSNREALNSLERLYRGYQQWEPLIDILRRKAELAESPEDVMELRRQIGELYEDRLSDSEKAIESYKEILTIEPRSLTALKALELLYERTNRVQEYLEVLEQELDVTSSEAGQISLYQRMASVWEERFNKLDRSAECLEKVLGIDARSEPTYRGLERLYRQDTRWDELVDVLSRHINATGDMHERVELYMQLGQTYEGPLQNPDRAIEAYGDILSFDPDHTQALDALARLYEQIESWDRAVDVMGRLTLLVDDPTYRVGIYNRLGRIYGERLKDQAQAEEHYQQALSIDPAHADSMMQLVEIYKARGDWAKAAQMMIRAEEHNGNVVEKARLLYEAGNAFLTQLDDEARATELFARTLQVDPDHHQAGDPLSKVYFRDGRYEEVEPVLDMLVRKADRRDNKLLQDLYFRLGKTADMLGKNDKALKYYRAAYDIDSTHLPTLTGMASLLYRMEDLNRAFKIYQTILVHHRESQKDEEIVEIFFRLGNIKLKLGERKKALNMFEKALEINSSHRDTLLAIVNLQGKQNDWEAVLTAKKTLAGVADAEEKFTILEECGDVALEKLQNQQKAIGYYAEALELQPESHVVLHKILDLYHETKQWKKMVEIVQRITDGEKDRGLRAKYYYTIAVIYRDEIKSLDESIDHFNKSLDESPDQLKAFEAIDRICTNKKDWKALERNYRKMIKRLPAEGQNELKVMLWHNLGEIYRTRLKDFKSATASFEVAASLEPDNMQRHEILAELYVLCGPDFAQKAVSEHQTLIRNSPFKIESYKALRKIYMDTRQYDKAWCLCSTLSFLKRADPEEQQFYEQYRQRGFVRAKARMTDELWSRFLFHPEQDRFIGAIFASIGPAVATLTAKPHKSYGLKRKERRDLANDQLLFSKVFNYVTSVLNVMQPELYLKPDQQIGLMLAHTTEVPSYVVGADLLQGRPEKELAFAIAKQLTYLRPEHFLRNVLPAPSQLRVVFFTALKMSNPKAAIPPAESVEVDKIEKHVLGRLHPGQLEQIAALVRKFVQSQAEVNLNKWWTAVELTANRVGFALCNDLEVAAKMVSTEPAVIGSKPPKEKVKELVLYSVSEEYFHVRNQLGLSIGQ